MRVSVAGFAQFFQKPQQCQPLVFLKDVSHFHRGRVIAIEGERNRLCRLRRLKAQTSAIKGLLSLSRFGCVAAEA